MKRLILGDGLLGKELIKQTNWDYISRKKNGFNFENIETYKKLLYSYDEIINCIAYTNTYAKEKEKHWNVNYKGVADLVDYCNRKNKKLIHISTSYVYGNSSISEIKETDIPVHSENWYSYTKLLADGYIELKSKNYLIIRTIFKRNPFPYDDLIVNQTGNFDYVDIISNLIIKIIEKEVMGIINVGTETKTMFDLAQRTNENVRLVPGIEIPSMPKNITMNIEKMENILND